MRTRCLVLRGKIVSPDGQECNEVEIVLEDASREASEAGKFSLSKQEMIGRVNALFDQIKKKIEAT